MGEDNHSGAVRLREGWYFLLLAALVAGLIWFDQFCKGLALQHLVPGEVKTVLSLPLAGDVCVLTLVWNTGAFLSLGAGNSGWLHTLTMIVVPMLALIAMIGWLCRPWFTSFRKQAPVSIAGELRIGLALFIAGGAGNLIDRMREGKVVDFLNFGIGSLRTGIMNVADLYIAFGLVFLVIYYFRHRPKKT